MKKHIYKTRWLSYAQACEKAICWSCVNDCGSILHNNFYPDSKWHNKKTKKTKTVIECNKYEEQIFNRDDNNKIVEVDVDIHNDIYHLMWKFCDKYCQGRHNITQSNDGWDYMIHELTEGFYYALTHRKEFNRIKKLGRITT